MARRRSRGGDRLMEALGVLFIYLVALAFIAIAVMAV